MQVDTVQVDSQPMLCVTRPASMAPEDIAGAMQEAFGVLGGFIGRTGIAPAGPPLAVYYDWDEAAGTMKIDIGFPVAEADTAKAEGDVKTGTTPSGKALKTVHRGAYAKLRETYGALTAHMMKQGLPRPETAWEVYITDPDTTPEDELLTEVYMPVP